MPAEKYVAVTFNKSLWTRDRATEWLKRQNLDNSLSEDLDGKLVFHLGDDEWGEHKNLGKGLVGILPSVVSKKTTVTRTEKEERDDDGDKKKEDVKDEGRENEGKDKKDEAPKDEKDGGEDGDKVKIPPGAQALKDLHGHYKGVHDYCSQMAEHIEHPDVSKCLAKRMKNAQSEMEDIHSHAGKAYPDLDFKALCEMGAESGETEKEGGDPKKKALAHAVAKKMHDRHKCILKDAADHLEATAESEHHPIVKRAHRFHAKAINDVIAGSNSPTNNLQKDMDNGTDGDDDADALETSKALKALNDRVSKAFAVAS